MFVFPAAHRSVSFPGQMVVDLLQAAQGPAERAGQTEGPVITRSPLAHDPAIPQGLGTFACCCAGDYEPMMRTTVARGAAMIDQHWDTDHSILTVRPESALSTGDFAALARSVDPKIEQYGDLAGLIIDAPRFPGWDSYGAMVSHVRFVHDHHRHVKKIAIVTDLPVAGVTQHLASHLVSAQIRQFPAGHVEQANKWITDGLR